MFNRTSDETLLATMREVTTPVATELKLAPEMLELWFYKVYSTLDLLVSNRFRAEDSRLFARAKSYRETMSRLLSHPKINDFLSKGDKRVLREGLTDILSDVNDALCTNVSPTEISLFCQVAESGRALFQSKKLNPDSFTEHAILELARMIRENYGAYEDTLRGLKV